MPPSKKVRRVQAQRNRRLKEGWKKVELWVPSEADALDIKIFADSLRRYAETLLHLPDVVEDLFQSDAMRLASDMQSTGTYTFTKTTGRGRLVSKAFFKAGNYRACSHAFSKIANAYPVHAQVMEDVISSMILDHIHVARGTGSLRSDLRTSLLARIAEALWDPALLERAIRAVSVSLRSVSDHG